MASAKPWASGSAAHEMADEASAAHAVSGEQLTSLLVLRAGNAQPKAVPLGLVTRLEEIATDKIELSNGRHMVQYREQLMPLVQMQGVSVQTSGAQPILVFADDGRSMGLVVDEIIDIVEERLHIEVAGSSEGILGSAVIKGQATEVIDVVLTDIEMPDMNGFEFAETIRADAHLASMPIIALSSMVSPAAIERGRLAGFHDYVAKFDRPGLIAALKEQTSEMNRAAAA